jgi:phenylpropionate dioxygenase-like ring-hydroxylating dioxygenase large terminal subunit
MHGDPVLTNDWLPVAHAQQLSPDRPLAVRLLGEDLVIWQNSGQVLAWQDRCPHRGAQLSQGRVEPADGTLACPYHGWRFDGSGACAHLPAHPGQQPPARAAVTPFHAREDYGLIWVGLGNPAGDVPTFAEWADERYRKVLCGPYLLNAAGPRVIENFLDVAHFPFVHAAFLGDPQHTAVPDYEAEITPAGVIARDIRVWQPDPDGSGVGSWASYTYHALRPLTARFTKHTSIGEFVIFLTVTPVEETRSIAWMWIAMNYGREIPSEQIRSFQDRIVAQDVPVVESQRPVRLPLDLQAELHLRSDRTSIAYRRWLRELGLTFGVS